MRNFSRLIAFALAIGLVLTGTYVIWAQQRRQGSQRPGQMQQRPQMSSEEMVQRMLEQTMRQLTLSEEETTVLKPKIEEILKIRIEQSTEMRELTNALREAINADDDAQIKEKLELVKAKRKEHKKKENKEKAEIPEKELVELLTLKQEAQLTVAGVVNTDGTDGFFGGFNRGRQQRPGRPQR